MAEGKSINVWDWPVRLFHWTLVVVIAVAFLSSEEDSALNQWHVLAGWVAAILVVFRIAWGFVGGEHSRFSDFVRPSRIADHISGILRGHGEPSTGHNPLGGASVLCSWRSLRYRSGPVRSAARLWRMCMSLLRGRCSRWSRCTSLRSSSCRVSNGKISFARW
jgi:cytochrome b